jgi:16S rRNA G966 N2-methylase RsmD
VLRRHVEDESVDLVYLDPPFNSNASYNVLVAERERRPLPRSRYAYESAPVLKDGARPKKRKGTKKR